MTVNTKL